MAGSPRAARFQPARLRAGEWVAGAAGLALVIDLVAVRWYRPGPASAGSPGITGWRALAGLRWPLAITGLGGVALATAQGRCRAPAIPVATAGVLAPTALATALATLVRVLHPPRGAGPELGAYVGLAATLAIPAAAVRSLRQEGTLERDAPQDIPTLRI